MIKMILAFVAFLALFGALDAVFLGVVARRFYKAEMGQLLRPKADRLAAAGFYAAYGVGVTALVIGPALSRADGAHEAFVRGLVLGFTAYATYNLTNLATVEGWPRRLPWVDLAWGSLATALAAAATTALVR